MTHNYKSYKPLLFAGLFWASMSTSWAQSGSNNLILGYNAGNAAISGDNNVLLGNGTGKFNTTGLTNVFVGNDAGFHNTAGSSNVFIGSQAGANNTIGNYNMFLGNGAGSANTTGVANAAIGDGALFNSTSGNENTAIGRYAGINNTTGTQNTFIGTAATNPPGSGNLTNATAIGFNASVTASNAFILGNTSVNVGIGNSAPNNKLEITKGSANQSGLRFTNLTSASPASVTSQYKFLTVNSSGDVILGSLNGSAREGVAETLWERKGSYLQSTQNDAVVIGSKPSKTPSGYKLFVEDGILTEKVKVAVKNTSEWSDKVFDEGYSLKGLSEVEQFIKTNKHLPGIPSAKEMVKKGNDLHQTDAKLLEKIEELTLYSIQQQKQNQQLKAEVDALKILVQQLLEKK